MKKGIITLLLIITCLCLNCITLKGEVINKVVKNLISDYQKFSLESGDDVVLTDEVIVQVKLDEEDFEDKTLINPDDQKAYRQAAKEYYSELNSNYFSNIDLINYESAYISKYSPYIEFKYNREEYYNLENYIVNELNNNEYVEMAYIKDNINNKVGNVNLSMRVAGAWDQYNNPEYTGEGIVVGVLELGLVDASHAAFANTTVQVYEQGGEIEHVEDHSTLMAAYIAGYDGVAPDATILSAYLLDTMVNEIDWMLDNDVNIINMSFGDANPTGDYSADSAYCDYIVKQYKVTIVVSAGNFGKTTALVSNPGLGYNVITVGSVGYNEGIMNFSSYVENLTAPKPTIMANGDQVISNSVYKLASGTSCSAAITSGIISLLMEKYPLLKTRPEMVLAMVTQSAYLAGTANLYNNGFHEQYGAGLIRYDNFINNYNNYTSILNLNGRSGVFIHQHEVYLEAGTTFKASIAWTAYATGTVSQTRFTDYDLYLTNSSGVDVKTAVSVDSNIEIVRYEVTESGYYKLKIKQTGTIKKPNEYIYIAMGEAAESVFD